MLIKMKRIEVHVRDALESSTAAAAGSRFQSLRKILRIIWELTFRQRRKRLLKVTQMQPDFFSSHCLKQEENSFWHSRPAACFPRARRRAGEQNACAAAAGRAAVGPLVQAPSAAPVILVVLRTARPAFVPGVTSALQQPRWRRGRPRWPVAREGCTAVAAWEVQGAMAGLTSRPLFQAFHR